MIFFKALAAILLFLSINSSIFSLGKKDSDSSQEQATSQETQTVEKKRIKIDFLLDTKGENKKNHFNWRVNSETYKDSFDAVSSASKSHSTKKFREAASDSAKVLLVPKGLRELLLFAVAQSDSLALDSLSVQSEGKKVTISFTHRKNRYRIQSDENGVIHVPDGFLIQLFQKPAPADSGQNSSEPENAPESAESAESKASETAGEDFSESDFVPDRPGEEIFAIYTGNLKVTLQKDILTIRGTLRLAKQEKEEPKNEEKPEETQAEADDSGENESEGNKEFDDSAKNE